MKPADMLPSLAEGDVAAPALPIEIQVARMEAWARGMLAQQEQLGSMAGP